MAQIGIYTERELEIFIHKNYGDEVSFSGKQKSLIKFGQNPNVGSTLEDVWATGGVEVLPTVAQGNVITHIASSSGSDTQTIVIEGMVADSLGNMTFTEQTVTLAGQTKTALTTPLYRCTRAYNSTADNLIGTVRIARDVTFSAGVPVSDIHATIQIGNEQTQKCAVSVSQYDYWAIEQITASVNRTQVRYVDFYFQLREFGGTFRTRIQPVSVSNASGTIVLALPQPFIVPPNSDVRVQAISSGSTTSVGAGIFGTMLIKKSQL